MEATTGFMSGKHTGNYLAQSLNQYLLEKKKWKLESKHINRVQVE